MEAKGVVGSSRINGPSRTAHPPYQDSLHHVQRNPEKPCRSLLVDKKQLNDNSPPLVAVIFSNSPLAIPCPRYTVKCLFGTLITKLFLVQLFDLTMEITNEETQFDNQVGIHQPESTIEHGVQEAFITCTTRWVFSHDIFVRVGRRFSIHLHSRPGLLDSAE